MTYEESQGLELNQRVQWQDNPKDWGFVSCMTDAWVEIVWPVASQRGIIHRHGLHDVNFIHPDNDPLALEDARLLAEGEERAAKEVAA
jgi:hypothetical protein